VPNETQICRQADCNGRLIFKRQEPDGDPNGTTLDVYECAECGALVMID
jgi:DNA-directed RNA polymerase subunit RPC12/RpoP